LCVTSVTNRKHRAIEERDFYLQLAALFIGEFLNTFMFYHNHRRYHAGKRKGKTPMEILTGQEQTQDWIQLLLKEVETKQQNTLLIA